MDDRSDRDRTPTGSGAAGRGPRRHLRGARAAPRAGAIEQCARIVDETEGVDPVTQDMVIDILRDEQAHRRLFEGFLCEYEFEGRT